MPRVSRGKDYKTSERKRAASKRTHDARREARKPTPSDVDEALSAAIQRLRAKVESGEISGQTTVLAVSDALVKRAARHLVRIRGFSLDPSTAAIEERMSKERRYRLPKANKTQFLLSPLLPA